MAKIPVGPMGGERFVVGSYEGDRAASRVIPLGFTPSFLSVWGPGGVQGYLHFDRDGSIWSAAMGGVCTAEHPRGNAALSIVEGGFRVAYNGMDLGTLTNDRGTYIYLALR